MATGADPQEPPRPLSTLLSEKPLCAPACTPTVIALPP